MTTTDRIALASAVVSILALLVTFVFAFLGRIYTKEQIRQVTAQIDEAKRQFTTLNTPDVQVDVYYQAKPPEKRGVWLKATNHHPTITVNDLLVYVLGDSPSEKQPFHFMFTTFGDLKPTQTVQERSLQDLESALTQYFPGYDPSGAFISADPIGGSSFDSFPLQLHYSYLPRLHGAQKIEGTREMHLSLLREKRI